MSSMAEIKISELSIGDWISDKNGIAAQVRGIECWSDGYVVNVRTKAGTITNLTVGGVLPIPLLPKILEKNGWLPPRKAIELDTWWWTNGVDKAIEAYEYKGEWHLTIIEQKEIQYRNRVGIGLKYVHQLQNALRLAGVEKEIEL